MKTLLIVDDEARVRKGLVNHITWEDLDITRIIVAENGKEAIEKIFESWPDLVLTDIIMPDMSGLELIEMARKMNYNGPFIIISGYADFNFAQQAIRFGVSEYILKPVNEKEVYQAASKILNHEEEEIIEKYDNAMINSVVEYIHKNYMHDLTLGDIAEYTELNPNYLSTIFTQVVGENFSKYLVRTRIGKSKKLLQNPSLRIYEVADMVGYHDHRYFAKCFKKQVKMTPLEYRNQKTM